MRSKGLAALAAAVFLLGGNSAVGQSPRADCAHLRAPLVAIAAEAAELHAAFAKHDEGPALRIFSGVERDAMLAMQAARLDLLSALAAYAIAADGAAEAMATCSTSPG